MFDDKYDLVWEDAVVMQSGRVDRGDVKIEGLLSGLLQLLQASKSRVWISGSSGSVIREWVHMAL